jgi:UDP-GlcNAc:undecaprenyl-phosphate GlcNAc-1-phosphate transferase
MLKSILPKSYHRYTEYLPLFFLAVVVSLILTPLIGYIARKLKFIAYPPSMRDGDKLSDFRHLEKPPTPLLGGLAVLIPLIILILINVKLTPTLMYFLTGIGIIIIGGVLDDKFEISYKKQMIFQTIAALLIVCSSLNLNYITNPFNGVWNLNWWQFTETFYNIPLSIVFPGDLILLVWILGCINAVKWVSGADGLMEGTSFFSTLTLFIISLRISNTSAATISIIFGGLIIGFLFYNFYPARIRSGSSGKTAYGFILAVLSVMSGTKFAVGIIILMLPLLDFLWVIIGRIRTHKPQSISGLMQISDQTHLHHRLLKLGLNETQVALLEYLFSAILGAIGLVASGAMTAFIWLGSGILTLIALIIISKMLKQNSSPPPTHEEDTSPESKYSY